jgi:hypothetical protein
MTVEGVRVEIPPAGDSSITGTTMDNWPAAEVVVL